MQCSEKCVVYVITDITY